MKKTAILLLSTLMLCSCAKTGPTVTTPTKIEIDPSQPPANSLTLEEKVGQLFMARCDSITIDDIKEKQPGGIIMFASDFAGLTKDEVCDKIDGFNDVLRVAPYISVDEEGGTVVRVSSNPNLASEKYESPQYYYTKGGIDLVLEKEREKSELLTSLGINMNLAPVVDVSKDPESFIYDRTLGKDAAETAEYAKKVVGVMDEYNIASCLKHFPGYGENDDTHVVKISQDYRPLSQFREIDFLPFTAGIDAGADFVLVSHNIIMDVDPDMPATLSKPMHDILRDELGFEGVIITDDMAMAAADGYKEPYKTAILAGNDMLIVGDFDTAYNEVLEAVKNGEIPEEVIDAAVNRILNAKIKRGII